MDSHKPDHPEGTPDWAMNAREKDNAARAAQGLPPRPKRRWPLGLAAGALVAGGAWYALQPTDPVASQAVASTATADMRMEINPQEYATITLGPVVRTLRVTGTLKPANEASVSGPVGGRLLSVDVRPGDRVVRGDTLAELDPEPLTLARDAQRANVAATQAQLTLAEAQLERTENLRRGGSVSASQLDSAISEANTLRAQLASQKDSLAGAELDLRNATITAPIDGVVVERAVNPGTTISSGATVAAIADLSTVEMDAWTPVEQAGRLRVGQRVAVTTTGAEGTFTGAIARINPVASSESRALSVFITIPNPDGVLFGGMYAVGQIATETREDSVSLPEEAIRTDSEGQHVLVVVDGRLERQGVEAHMGWSQGQALIASGLSEGDVVVSAALPELAAGDAVVLVE